MFAWFSNILSSQGSDTPAEQLEVIKEAIPEIELTLEERIRRVADRTRNYGQRSEDELKEIVADLDVVLDIMEALVSALENVNAADDARRLRTRLRGARTRAQNLLIRRSV